MSFLMDVPGVEKSWYWRNQRIDPWQQLPLRVGGCSAFTSYRG